MSQDVDYRQYYVVSAQKVAINFFRPDTAADVPVVVVCLLCVVLGGTFGNSLVAFVIFLAGLGVMYRWDEGRTYMHPVFFLSDRYIRYVKKGVIASPKFTRSGEIRKFLKNIVPEQPFPLGDGMSLDIGAVYNKTADTNTLYIVAGGAPFRGETIPEQYDDLIVLDDGVVKSRHASKKVVGYSTRFSTRPPDVNEFWDIVYDTYAPDVVGPAGLKKDQSELTSEDHAHLFAHRELGAQADEFGKHCKDVVMAYGVTVPNEKVFRELRKAQANGAKGESSLTRQQLRQTDLFKATQTCESAIRNIEGEDVHLATYAETLRIVRGGWDVVNIDQFYDQVGTFVARSMADDESSSVVETASSPEEASFIWPTDVRVFKYACQTENTWHTVFRVTTMEEFSLPEFQHRLHRVVNRTGDGEMDGGVPYYTISQVGVCRGSTSAYWLTGQSLVLLDIFRDWYGMTRTGPRAKKRTSALEAKQELQDAKRVVMHYSYLVHVLAASREDLERYAERMRVLMDDMGLSPKRVKGESRQFPALRAAITTTQN